NVKVEVAEQFHRRPLEQLKLRLIDSGLLGTVHTSFNDFAGHGYHGVSVMRSYLGFDAVPVQVTGAVRSYPLAAHWSRLAGTTAARLKPWSLTPAIRRYQLCVGITRASPR